MSPSWCSRGSARARSPSRSAFSARRLSCRRMRALRRRCEAAAEQALGGSDDRRNFDRRQLRARPSPRRGTPIRGLFAGGTLCAEAQVDPAGGGRKVAPTPPFPARHRRMRWRRAARPHHRSRRRRIHPRPPAPDDRSVVRDRRLRAALADPELAVILLDLVIGFGAHADPAGILPASRRSRCRCARHCRLRHRHRSRSAGALAQIRLLDRPAIWSRRPTPGLRTRARAIRR